MEQSAINQKPDENLDGNHPVSKYPPAPRPRSPDDAHTRIWVGIKKAEAAIAADPTNLRHATFRLLDELTVALAEMGFTKRGDPTFPLTKLAIALEGLERGKVSPILKPKRGSAALHGEEWLCRAYLCAAAALLTAKSNFPEAEHAIVEAQRLNLTKLAGVALPLLSGQAEKFVASEIKRRCSRQRGDYVAKNLSQWRSRFEAEDKLIPIFAKSKFQEKKAEIGRKNFSPGLTALVCIDYAVDVFPDSGASSGEFSG